jgi:hypothetical protein
MIYETYNKRITRDGYTPEQAWLIPVGMPRWMWLVEQEESMPIVEVVKREKSAGVSDAQIACSFGVSKHVLSHWMRKWKREGKL